MESSKDCCWMRCNKCSINFDKNRFNLTQCGHVFCNKCINQAEKKCFECAEIGTISLPLREPISPQIAHYFTNPSETLQKAIQSFSFVEQQRDINARQFKTLTNKYNSLKEAYWTLNENFKKTMQKYHQLKMAYMTMVQKQTTKQSSNRNNTPHSSKRYETSSQKVNNSESNDSSFTRTFVVQQRTPDDSLFRVPSSRRVPRSNGYYTQSSRDSNSSLNTMIHPTPNSSFNYN